MLKLRTLGSLSIDGFETSAEGFAVHRKRLALLAVIGTARSDGISRDRLLGLFWPESREERARHALAQSLYALRRTLGVDDLFLGNQELRINRSLIDVDAWSFEQLVASGELESAVELYRGPFLDGVYLDGAAEFEEWTQSERQRLAHRYTGALQSLANAREQSGDHARALAWWRRLALEDPLAAGPALGIMRSLVACGEPAAALQYARAYEERLASTLEIQCPPEFTAFAGNLRARLAAVRLETPIDGGCALDVSALGDRAPEAELAPAVRDDHSHIQTRSHRRLPGFVVASLAALLVGLIGISLLTAHSRATTRRLDADRVAVFPFVADSNGVEYLADGMVDLLAADLDSAGAIQIVDPRALVSRVNDVPRSRRDPNEAASIAAGFGAGTFLLGSITELNERIELTASLYRTDAPREPVAHASARGDRSDMFGLVDRIATELLAERLGAPGQRLDRLAALTTSSLPALKAYLLGEREMRARHYPYAIDRFLEAIALDSSFALAHYRLSIAADWSGRLPLADSAAADAARHASRLSLHDRMLVDALFAWRKNDIETAERLYGTLVLLHPDDVEAWYQLGEVYFHNNPPRGRSFVEARIPFERALALEPSNRDAPTHLMRIAAWEERWGAVDSLLRRVELGDEDVTLTPYRALARRDPAALDRAITRLGVFDANALMISTERLAVYTHRLDVAQHLGVALTNPTRPANERAIGYQMLAYLLAAQGRWREARRYADSTRGLLLHLGVEARARLAAAPFSPYQKSEIVALIHDALRASTVTAEPVTGWRPWRYPPPEYPLRLTAVAGILAAAIGDTAFLQSAAATLSADRTPGPQAWRDWRHDRSALLAALSMRAAGRVKDAVVALGFPHPPDDDGTRDEERFLLAELLRDSGRLDEAVRWFGSFENMLIEDLPWAAPAHLMRARVLERLGRRHEAALDYARVAELWHDCDPELKGLYEEARDRAALLRRD